MRPAAHFSKRLAVFLLIMCAGSAPAAPVPVGEAEGRIEGAQAAQTLAPGLSGPAATLAATDSPASGPSTGALAAEILKEATAGEHGTEAPRSAPRATAQTGGQAVAPRPSAQGQTQAAEDEWGLRDMSKAAVHWLKEAVPWLRDSADGDNAGRPVGRETAEWSAPTTDDVATGPRVREGASPQAGTATEATPSATIVLVDLGDAQGSKLLDPDQNVVRQVITLIQEVVGHPMTWLVVALFVIGGIVVKKIDRRPTK